MFAFVRKSDYKSNNSTENNLSLKQLAKKHRDFPLYRAPEELFNTISQNLPILLLTSLFGPASAGFYSIGRTVLGFVLGLLVKQLEMCFTHVLTRQRIVEKT